jgi:hypothetical protein
MWNRIRKWWKAEGDWAQLQGASDRMLDDMGLKPEGLRDRVLGREGNPVTETRSPCACLPAARLSRS